MKKLSRNTRPLERVFETERLIFEPADIHHVENVHELLTQTIHLLCVGYEYSTTSSLQEDIAEGRLDMERGDSSDFVVKSKITDEIIGYVLIQHKAREDAYSTFCIKEVLWNKGYGTEIFNAIVWYLKTFTNSKVLSMTAHNNSPGANKILQNSGAEEFSLDGCGKSLDNFRMYELTL